MNMGRQTIYCLSYHNLKYKKYNIYLKLPSVPISRVLSSAAIYLGTWSPMCSSHFYCRSTGSRFNHKKWYLLGVASNRVYRTPQLPEASVSSYLAFPPLPTASQCDTVGGISLLHYPQSRLRLPLAAILPCEARTFLMARSIAMLPHSTLDARSYYIFKYIICQVQFSISERT